MTYINPALNDLLVKAEQENDIWVERAKLAFAMELNSQCRAAGITNTQLAKMLGTSAAYITKVFRGDTNFTIETMVKLARAVGASLDVKLVNSATLSLSPQINTSSVVISKGTKVPVTTSSARDFSVEIAMDDEFGYWSSNAYVGMMAAQNGYCNA